MIFPIFKVVIPNVRGPEGGFEACLTPFVETQRGLAVAFWHAQKDMATHISWALGIKAILSKKRWHEFLGCEGYVQ